MADQNHVVMIGAGGHARVVAEALLPRDVVGHVTPASDGAVDHGVLGPRLGDDAEIAALASSGHDVAIGVGCVDRPTIDRRATMLAELGSIALLTVVHPESTLSPSATLAEGTFVAAAAVVGTGTSIGRAAIVNTGALIDHDCRIGANVHVAPGVILSGGVEVGDNTLLGVGATVRQNVRIGSNVIVGAGAVVVGDLPDGVTAVGVPAAVLDRRR